MEEVFPFHLSINPSSILCSVLMAVGSLWPHEVQSCHESTAAELNLLMCCRETLSLVSMINVDFLCTCFVIY